LSTANPFQNLADHDNERALAYLAISDFVAYRALGLEPAQYDLPLFRRVVSLAEAVYEEQGQVGPSEQLFRVLTLGREHQRLTPEEHAAALDYLLDRPLGLVPDAEKLKRQFHRRKLDEAFTVGQRALRDGRDADALGLVDQAREDATRALYEGSGVRNGAEALERWLEEVMRRAREPGISLGLPRLKEAVGNIPPGNVLVIGGGTNVGKSSVVLEMLLAAARDGTTCGLVSMEDPEFTTITRLVSTLSGVTPRALLDGYGLERATAALVEARELLRTRLLSAECIGMNEADVCARMTVMAQQGARLIVVDYIGEVGVSAPQQDRRNEIRWIMKRLKTHALRLGVALVVVSQLHRPKDGDTKKEPNKHSLKEAGDLENSADYIVLLWREEEDDYAPVNLKLAKSKTGSVGATWQMQRELYVEDARGDRVPGSARLREVVRERRSIADREFPLLIEPEQLEGARASVRR